MPRPALTAVWLVICLSTPLGAQGPEVSSDSVDVLILDHDFATMGDLAWIFLTDREVYRAELSSPDVILEVRSRLSRVRPPRVYSVLAPISASGASVVEIYPDQDGEYEIRAVGIRGSRIATRLRLYRDVSSSRRRLATVNRPGWELGIELAAGWHSGFAQTRAAFPVASETEGGADLEGCFSVRPSPGSSRFNLCVLGFSYQSQRGGSNILWIYTEPRVRILGRPTAGQSHWELGALSRLGVGMISEATDTPVSLAPGIYVARQIRTSSQGAGWSFQLSYSRAFHWGFPRPLQSSGSVIPQSHRVALGVGWYR